MLHRRTVLGALALPLAPGFAFASGRKPVRLSRANLDRLAQTPGDPQTIAKDEDFWAPIQRAFTQDRSITNLNNGGCSPAPAIVQEAQRKHLERANFIPPPIALWREQEPARERVRVALARQWGVDPEEIAITRNSSESLQICQFGHDLSRGDEVLTTTLDYPRMLTTFKQRERREGLVLKQFKLPIPCEDPAQIVRLFAENITPKTRLILMSHIINITGQILPVKDVVAMARTKNGGIPVIVDGAHALAHFEFKISDLNCDFYGVSLHKWLFAPHGTGLLYVRKEKIKGLWPLMASGVENENDIRKYEEIGTHPVAATLAIAEALTFHQGIGGPRKEARLRYLRDRWATRLLAHPSKRVRLHTSLKPAFSCGIATVQVDDLDTTKLGEYLWDKHGILTTPIKHAEFEGLRVTPSVYTTLAELDRFCDAMEFAIDKGLPVKPAT
ncbi:MAG: aminotransferase class V-fold PLP-dependent enzyme [Planctomycetota bacterium]